MKHLLAVLVVPLLGVLSLLPAQTSAAAGSSESTSNLALTVSPAAIAAGNDYWKSLGVTPPEGGFILAHPWSSPWSGRSLIVPAAWFERAFDETKKDAKSKVSMPVDADALRKDLPILQRVLEKNYSGWEPAAKRGWDWNNWFRQWNQMLASYGEKSIPDKQAFAPWFALERFQIDSHSGPEVPSRFGNIIFPRSAMLAGAPRAACTDLRMADGTRHLLSADDEAQQPHAVKYWNGKTLTAASYLVYPSSLGTAEDVTCGGQRVALATFQNAYAGLREAPALKESITVLSGGKRGLAVYNTPMPAIGYLRLAAFDDAGDEALTRLLPHLPSSAGREKLLIVDLRGNDGGGAPFESLSRWIPLKQVSPRLMQIGKRSCLFPGLWFNQAQVLSLGVKHASARDMRETESAYARGIGAPAAVDCPVSFQTSAGKWTYTQHHFVREWHGRRPRLLVLVDQGCASDCEAMTWLLAQLPGTVIAGRNTFGVIGFTQPGFLLLPHTHIAFQLATSRTEAYGDGRSEDGYGLDVDVALPTASDWSARSILALAKQLVTGSPSKSTRNGVQKRVASAGMRAGGAHP